MDITAVTRFPRLETISPTPLLHNGMQQAQHFWKPLSHKYKRDTDSISSFLEVLIHEKDLADDSKASGTSVAEHHADKRNIAAYYLELSAP